MLCQTGVRCSELLDLRLGDLDFLSAAYSSTVAKMEMSVLPISRLL